LHVDGIESVSIQTPIDDIAVGKQQYVVLNAIVLSQVTA
jgi:phage-related baseplate assembly protein